MSYGILYDAFAIEISSSMGVIPMILAGSNNCYERNNRRARSWQVSRHLTGDDVYDFPANILLALDQWRDEVAGRSHSDTTYKDASFGWYAAIALAGKSCGATSFGALRRFYERALAHVLTVERLLEHGVVLKLAAYNDGGGALRLESSTQLEQELPGWKAAHGANRVTIYVDAAPGIFGWNTRNADELIIERLHQRLRKGAA